MREPQTVAELRQITGGALSHKAYRLIDGEPTLVGKWCRAVYLGGDTWDVWLCNPENIGSGLTQRRIRSLTRRIAEITRDTGPFRELDGEGVYLAMPSATLLQTSVYRVLGLRSRRVMTGGRQFAAVA